MALFNILDKFKKKDTKQDVRYRDKTKAKSLKKDEVSDESGEIEEEKKPKALKIKESALASKILISPIVTEKSTRLSESRSYVFKVRQGSTKPEIKKAVEELYGVKVGGVNVINQPSKKRTLRGVTGTRPGYRKAVVSLTEGQKIELI